MRHLICEKCQQPFTHEGKVKLCKNCVDEIVESAMNCGRRGALIGLINPKDAATCWKQGRAKRLCENCKQEVFSGAENTARMHGHYPSPEEKLESEILFLYAHSTSRVIFPDGKIMAKLQKYFAVEYGKMAAMLQHFGTLHALMDELFDRKAERDRMRHNSFTGRA